MWLVLYLGSPPVPEPRVLDDLPEARIRHARGRRRVEEMEGGYPVIHGEVVDGLQYIADNEGDNPMHVPK